MIEEFVNTGGGMGYEILESSQFQILAVIFVVFFFILRSWNGRPGFWQDEYEYSLLVGTSLFLLALSRFWYGEASVSAYGESCCSLTLDIWLNSYEITVALTFLIFGVFIPSFFFPLQLETGPSMTLLRLISTFSFFVYLLPSAFNSIDLVFYFQVLDLLHLGLFVGYVVGYVAWWR